MKKTVLPTPIPDAVRKAMEPMKLPPDAAKLDKNLRDIGEQIKAQDALAKAITKPLFPPSHPPKGK